MNLLGKILTILILLSSIVFLTLALIIGASHQNWQAKAKEFKELATKETQRADAALAIQKKKELQLRAEQMARVYRIASQSSLASAAAIKADSKEKDLATAQQKLTDLTSQNKTAQDTIAENQKIIDNLRKQNTTLVEQVAQIRKDVVALSNEKFNLEGTKRNLEDRQKNLEAVAANLTRVLRGAGLTENSQIGHIAPKNVSGKVIAINRSGHFQINIGSDDGLYENHRVNVYRGSKFVGEAIVVDVKHNSSTARIIEDLNKFPLRIEDYVTTKR